MNIKKNKLLWCNIPYVYHIWNGEYGDPEIEYKKHILNEWDVQEYIGDVFDEEMQANGNIITDTKWHDSFDKWCYENRGYVKAMLDDMIWSMNGCY